jgi:sortase A
MMLWLLSTFTISLCLTGCSLGPDPDTRSKRRPSGVTAVETQTPPPAVTPNVAPTTPTTPTTPTASDEPEPASDGRARVSRLSIPAIDLEGLVVQPYRGSPDDAPGTRIQDRGVGASPGGPRGGVGPGGVGNFLVTAHRTSSTRPFSRLPQLRRGDRVQVEVREPPARVRYTYEIVRTRSTSFRSKRSLEQQVAAVPGRPGLPARRAMITLSTCATPEDHAAGNNWSDEFGNPEHRIDKIGVLIQRSTVPSVP